MDIFLSILRNFDAFILAIIITLVPYAGLKLPVIDTAKENPNLTVEMISDVHIEKNELLRKQFLMAGLTNLKFAQCDIDAIVVPGDITNYADEASLSEYYRIINDYTDIPVITVSGNHDIGHAGDMDVTDISREEALANFLRYRNLYMGREDTVNYFATDINGYHFIILGDECIDGGHWDAISMTDEQLAFLDRELAEGTKDGKPCFVLCHYPLDGINGEDTIWNGSGIGKDEYDIRPILEKYKNVYWISGHMHSGVKAAAIDEWYSLSNAEVVNGVTYLNLPCYGIVNMYGLPISGTGAQLEVYDDEVIFRPRNFITNKWYVNAEYHYDIVK